MARSKQIGISLTDRESDALDLVASYYGLGRQDTVRLLVHHAATGIRDIGRHKSPPLPSLPFAPMHRPLSVATATEDAFDPASAGPEESPEDGEIPRVAYTDAIDKERARATFNLTLDELEQLTIIGALRTDNNGDYSERALAVFPSEVGSLLSRTPDEWLSPRCNAEIAQSALYKCLTFRRTST
jgi:hypothetical protein